MRGGKLGIDVNSVDIVCDYGGQKHFEEASHILVTWQQWDAATQQGMGWGAVDWTARGAVAVMGRHAGQGGRNQMN